MMRNPVHSRFCSSNAPSPHRNELPGAENSGSENTSPTLEKALMLKSTPMKSTLCCFMYPCNRRRRSVEASRFLATILWTTCGVFVDGENHRVGLKGVLVEQDGEVRVASVRNELIGAVVKVITGVLENNRMKPSASRCDDIGGVPARWAWVPLKNTETVLMMHEVTVNGANVTKPVRFGMAKSDPGEYQGARLWKRCTSRTRVCTDGMVGSR